MKNGFFIVLATALSLLSLPASAQQTINGNAVTVGAQRLPDALAAKADASATAAALAAKADAATVAAALAAKANTSQLGTSSRLSLGVGVATPQQPSLALFVVPPTATQSSGNVIGHTRATVFTGDWTVRATVTTVATGGTSAWSIGGQTATIAWNATAADVQTALSALSSVGAGALTVTGGPGATAPYAIAYTSSYIRTNRFRELTVNGSNLIGGSIALVWSPSKSGADTGFVFGENSYTVTGTASGDGNGIAVLYGLLAEADIRSNATIGSLIGASAEASFAGTNATGYVDRIVGFAVNPTAHKDGALPQYGTAGTVVSLSVAGAQSARTLTDGVLASGSPIISSTTAQFAVLDVGKVVVGPGIPADTYIQSAAGASATLSQNATTSATGVTFTIKGTAQADTAYTAQFAAGAVTMNGQLALSGWKDEIPLLIDGNNNQSSDLLRVRLNTQQRFRVQSSGTVISSGDLIVEEGQTTQSRLGFVPGVGKAGTSFSAAQDTSLYRDSVGVLATGGGLRLGNNPVVTSGNSAVAAGSRIFSGSGAPGTITGAASGDFYFRSDTPTVAGQRLYTFNGTTWTGIL